MGEIKIMNIPLNRIEPNRGQIEGLPKNPRVIKDKKFEKLKKSIQDNPEMLALRELLVWQGQAWKNRGRYIVIGGNMRYRAMQDLGMKEAPCKVIPEDIDLDTLRAYIIKDNGEFGEWDMDSLANEWDTAELGDFGLDMSAWTVRMQDFDDSNVEIDVDDFGESMLLKMEVTAEDYEFITGKLNEIVPGDRDKALLKVTGWFTD